MSKGNRDSSPENKPDFDMEKPGTTARFVENRLASTSQESQETRKYHNLLSLLQSPPKLSTETSLRYLLPSPSRRSAETSLRSLLSSPSKCSAETSLQESRQHAYSEIMSPLKKQATFIHPSQRTRTFSVPADVRSTSRTQETAESEKQRKRTRSSFAETTSASRKQVTAANPRKEGGEITPTKAVPSSREQITAIHPRQEKRTIYSPIETSVSREQVTAESRPNPAEPTSEKVYEYIVLSSDSSDSENGSSETSKRTSLISQQQSSASTHESPLKSPSQHSKALQDTEIEKDDDGLKKRLELFDEFTCVKCLVKFATRDELLSHEPTHFND